MQSRLAPKWSPTVQKVQAKRPLRQMFPTLYKLIENQMVNQQATAILDRTDKAQTISLRENSLIKEAIKILQVIQRAEGPALLQNSELVQQFIDRGTKIHFPEDLLKENFPRLFKIMESEMNTRHIIEDVLGTRNYESLDKILVLEAQFMKRFFGRVRVSRKTTINFPPTTAPATVPTGPIGQCRPTEQIVHFDGNQMNAQIPSPKTISNQLTINPPEYFILNDLETQPKTLDQKTVRIQLQQKTPGSLQTHKPRPASPINFMQFAEPQFGQAAEKQESPQDSAKVQARNKSEFQNFYQKCHRIVSSTLSRHKQATYQMLVELPTKCTGCKLIRISERACKFCFCDSCVKRKRRNTTSRAPSVPFWYCLQRTLTHPRIMSILKDELGNGDPQKEKVFRRHVESLFFDKPFPTALFERFKKGILERPGFILDQQDKSHTRQHGEMLIENQLETLD